jgi:hypothetical protein
MKGLQELSSELELADCVAVIGAVMEVEDVKVAVDNLNEAMS